jgi:hypothetical protein
MIARVREVEPGLSIGVASEKALENEGGRGFFVITGFLVMIMAVFAGICLMAVAAVFSGGLG